MSIDVNNGRPDYRHYAIVMLSAILLAIQIHGVTHL
jgi:hypothetical protein